MVHISGIWMVIEARGGISTLENNQDLLLMISWYVRSLSATLSVIFSDSMVRQG
jgi:hypothetical protein